MKPPSPSRQVAFHQLLVAARKLWLTDALREAASRVDPRALKNDLSQYVPHESQKLLSAVGIRDEEVFPTPILLKEMPTLVGYYRLLLGASQKAFYAPGTGLGIFKNMEERGVIRERQTQALPAFCESMAVVLSELIHQLSPTVTSRDVSELQLLTLGSKFQGSNNNAIGRQATEGVFLAITDIVKVHLDIDMSTPKKLVVENASGRRVVLALAADPDVRIQEEFDGALRNKVAIEIKGGTDKSNAHNRAGEAEKSHLKAREQEFRDFWTIISKRALEMRTLKKESPTTTSWFDVAQVLGREGDDWEEFRSRIASAVGIPLA